MYKSQSAYIGWVQKHSWKIWSTLKFSKNGLHSQYARTCFRYTDKNQSLLAIQHSKWFVYSLAFNFHTHKWYKQLTWKLENTHGYPTWTLSNTERCLCRFSVTSMPTYYRICTALAKTPGYGSQTETGAWKQFPFVGCDMFYVKDQTSTQTSKHVCTPCKKRRGD